ncbi:hypothetical protein EYF80_021004 [Liparis tanakae]|uniref:Uncharacterized protein n=1 Tax=Liparis tanakae TaxID=230148 RepID=A0A4Z2HSI6_9TELE|nr:hypothetical protein EYF80_021004 [Liparis tanakae]
MEFVGFGEVNISSLSRRIRAAVIAFTCRALPSHSIPKHWTRDEERLGEVRCCDAPESHRGGPLWALGGAPPRLLDSSGRSGCGERRRSDAGFQTASGSLYFTFKSDDISFLCSSHDTLCGKKKDIAFHSGVQRESQQI